MVAHTKPQQRKNVGGYEEREMRSSLLMFVGFRKGKIRQDVQ